jgi:hypothetical protein
VLGLFMGRFILRFNGVGEKPAEDVQRIRSLPNATVLDDSARMILIEAHDAAITELVKLLPQWGVSQESFVLLPDPRPKLRKPAAH